MKGVRRGGKKKAAGTISHEELAARVKKALGLLDSETADGIIGMPPGDEYDALIQGAAALLGMEWALMKSHGMVESPESLRGGNQTLLMMTTIVHYAYALGLKRGRWESES